MINSSPSEHRVQTVNDAIRNSSQMNERILRENYSVFVFDTKKSIKKREKMREKERVNTRLSQIIEIAVYVSCSREAHFD